MTAVDHEGQIAQLRELLEANRSRVHNLADKVQDQEGRLREHGALIPMLARQIETVQQTTPTSTQLDAMIAAVKATLDAYHQQNSHALALINERLDPIRRGIFWAVMLIVGAVLTAIVGAVVVKPWQGVPNGGPRSSIRDSRGVPSPPVAHARPARDGVSPDGGSPGN